MEHIEQDVGYGYGWELLDGVLTPQHAPGGALAGYLLMDATGATYRLDVNTGGVWTSRETYVSYDSGANRLYFNDGSFWVMGCVSAETESDAGTMYPTLMQDTNGNQIKVWYLQGTRRGTGHGRSDFGDRECAGAAFYADISEPAVPDVSLHLYEQEVDGDRE